MINIRKDQIAVFKKTERDRFCERLTKHLRKHYTKETSPYSEVQLYDYCRECIDRAGKYGLETERAIAYYCQLHWVLGLDFEQSENCRFAVDMLNDKKIPPTDRACTALCVATEFRNRGVFSSGKE